MNKDGALLIEWMIKNIVLIVIFNSTLKGFAVYC